MSNSLKTYVFNILISIDQFVNVLLAGEVDETLSSRAYRMKVKGHKYWGWTADAIDWLFFWQRNHCEKSHLDELARMQLPPELRGTPAAKTFWDDEWQS